MKRRQRERVDSSYIRQLINVARERIFNAGRSLVAKVVDGILKSTSLVPVRVRPFLS
jgi:hypothetical protein